MPDLFYFFSGRSDHRKIVDNLKLLGRSNVAERIVAQKLVIVGTDPDL